MRLDYAPSQPPSNDPQTTEIYTRIANRRHPRPLIPLDLTLLHSPPVADGYNSFLNAIRNETILDQGLMELAICRIGALNRAVWEWKAHAVLAVKAGVSRAALEAVLDVASGVGEERVWKGLGQAEEAVVRYTDAMTRHVDVPQQVFVKLREVGLNEREIVELTAGIAAYNCVSRFLVALDVGEMNGKGMEIPEDAK
jgi:alkylhydroperoxidase family enzyme